MFDWCIFNDVKNKIYSLSPEEQTEVHSCCRDLLKVMSLYKKEYAELAWKYVDLGRKQS